jgi:protein-tyrosine kinase
MEQIRQAVERARTTTSPSPRRLPDAPSLIASLAEEVELDSSYLLANRIVSYDSGDLRSRAYDVLRTHVLRSMDQHGWRVLGVTSPTSGCGKTLTAINLTFSIARMQDRSVALADLDLRKPVVGQRLGVTNRGPGLVDVVKGQTTVRDTMMVARAGNQRIHLLHSRPTKGAAELMASHAMQDLLQELKREHHTVILDLPPILAGDDVMCILPQIDCVLLVAAVGLSKTSEIEESVRHLETTPLVRLVANKATDEVSNYYY